MKNKKHATNASVILAVSASLALLLGACSAPDPAQASIVPQAEPSTGESVPLAEGSVSETIQTTSSSVAAPAGEQDIGLEKAKQIALEHAGLSADQVVFIKEKRDYDDGRLEYEIKFVLDSTRYSYDIDAANGTIRYFSQNTQNTQNTQSKQDTSIPSSETDIGLEKAKAIALEHAGLTEGQVTLLKAKWDYDDGIFVYELEWYANGLEYEYVIRAATGEILEIDVDN